MFYSSVTNRTEASLKGQVWIWNSESENMAGQGKDGSWLPRPVAFGHLPSYPWLSRGHTGGVYKLQPQPPQTVSFSHYLIQSVPTRGAILVFRSKDWNNRFTQALKVGSKPFTQESQGPRYQSGLEVASWGRLTTLAPRTLWPMGRMRLSSHDLLWDFLRLSHILPWVKMQNCLSAFVITFFLQVNHLKCSIIASDVLI